jgi:hypothetical protein
MIFSFVLVVWPIVVGLGRRFFSPVFGPIMLIILLYFIPSFDWLLMVFLIYVLAEPCCGFEVEWCLINCEPPLSLVFTVKSRY